MAAQQSIGEKIWQGSLGGLFGGLVKAYRLQAEGNIAAAIVHRASTYYSYGLIPLARGCAEQAARFHSTAFSDGQCDVIGTILLRRFFWIKPDPLRARLFLHAGLRKNPASESEALLRIGLAEVGAVRGLTQVSKEEAERALELRLTAIPVRGLSKAQFKERAVQIDRQFTRVFRRAMVLAWNRGDPITARSCYLEALKLATDSESGSKSQEQKLTRAWDRLQKPRWWHKYMD